MHWLENKCSANVATQTEEDRSEKKILNHNKLTDLCFHRTNFVDFWLILDCF